MPELTERQKTILMLVVRDYIDTAQPVSSQRLVERYHLSLSSATIRNELMALTEMGYLRQPHTSAGRVPTEEGYRYFVGHMMHPELPENVQNTISHQFYQARPEIEHWMTLAASVLAHQSQALSLVTAPHAEQVRCHAVELISTQGRQVLMVLVLVGGEVSQPDLSLSEPVSQERLSAAASRLNQAFEGRTLEEILAQPARSDALESDITTSSSGYAPQPRTGGRELYYGRPDQRAGRAGVRRFGRSPPRAAPVRGAQSAPRTALPHDSQPRRRQHSGHHRRRRHVGGTAAVFDGAARYGIPGVVTGTLERAGADAHVPLPHHPQPCVTWPVWLS